MDINGAKALRARLGSDEEAPQPARVSVDLPDDAPPVFHWLGVVQPAAAAASDDD